MPEPLINATIDYRNGLINWDAWQERIARRENYLVRPIGRPDREGSQRYACPAYGANATAKCPLKEFARSRSAKNGIVLIIPAHVPKMPDKVCRQSTITIPASAGLKFRQDVRFGTAQWVEVYSRARNTIEGWNGHLKDEAHTALANAGRRRIRGFAAQMLLISMLVSAANVAKIRKWLVQYSRLDPKAPAPPARVRRRGYAITAVQSDAPEVPTVPR